MVSVIISTIRTEQIKKFAKLKPDSSIIYKIISFLNRKFKKKKKKING